MIAMVLKTKTDVLSNRILLLLAVAIFLINQLPCLADMRGMGNDESWYANTAYNLSKGNGLFQTSVGYNGNANCLIPLLVAASFKLFGYSLFSIRIVSVLSGAVTLFFINAILDELRASKFGKALTFLLFVSLPVFNTAFRFGRPEGAALMCLAGGGFFYLRYVKTQKWKDAIGLDLACFLGALAHPFVLFSFFFWGIYLLVEQCKKHDRNSWPQLLSFVVFAIAGIGLVAYLSSVYNPIERSDMFLDRVSPRNALNAAMVYYNDIFLSRYALYSYPTVAVLICAGALINERKLRVLAWITLINGFLFPFVFSTDVVMLPFGWHYIVIIAVILVAPLWDSLEEKLIIWRRKRLAVSIFVSYAVVCLALSYVYNAKKYEKCNTVMSKDLISIIPKESLVYGPICQYFCAIESRYYSDHYYTNYPLQLDFDYLIFNSRDLPLYPMSQELFKRVSDYDLVYSRETKQYGKVQVYQKKRAND